MCTAVFAVDLNYPPSVLVQVHSWVEQLRINLSGNPTMCLNSVAALNSISLRLHLSRVTFWQIMYLEASKIIVTLKNQTHGLLRKPLTWFCLRVCFNISPAGVILDFLKGYSKRVWYGASIFLGEVSK